MQEVKLPDGSVVSFPDGMSAADINAALANFRPAPADQRPLGTPHAPAGATFDALPWPQRLGVAADDIVRLIASGATFGYADKLAGAVGGAGTQAERDRTQAARERAGLAGDVAEIGGAFAPGLGAYRAGATAANLIPRSLSGLPGFAARTGAAAVDGAAYGALAASGNDRDIGTGALTGAAIGAVARPVAEGIGGLINRLLPKGQLPAAANTEALRDAGGAAYRRADQAGIIVRPEGLQRLGADIKASLAEAGYHPQLQPKIGVVLDELDRISQGNVTLKGLDVLRRIAGAAKVDADPSTRKLGGEVVSKIDDYLSALKPGDVLSGNRTEGVGALLEARKLWQMARKSEAIDEAVERATNQAASTGSGGNIDNALRQQFKAILNSPKRRLGWTPDELGAIRTIVRGTPLQNVTRLVGKLSPEGNGLSLLLNLGGAFATGGATLPATAAGIAAKAAADRATPNNVFALARIIAAGGDASKVAAAQKAAERLPQTEREALTRVLTSWGVEATIP